jgi:hypothetical protein
MRSQPWNRPSSIDVPIDSTSRMQSDVTEPLQRPCIGRARMELWSIAARFDSTKVEMRPTQRSLRFHPLRSGHLYPLHRALVRTVPADPHFYDPWSAYPIGTERGNPGDRLTVSMPGLLRTSRVSATSTRVVVKAGVSQRPILPSAAPMDICFSVVKFRNMTRSSISAPVHSFTGAQL